MIDLDAVNVGFSRKAAVYDAYGAEHPAIRWARGLVRARVLSLVAPGARLLELNAGTGEDAAWLAGRGYRVHATDIADGMLAEIARKVHEQRLEDRLTVQRCSLLELDRVDGGPYDLVLSNFGGLNCVSDVRPVAARIPSVLRAGGHVVWVVMPPVCPWELAQALRGRFRVAFRRLRGATVANVEGARVLTTYHWPRAVVQSLGPAFRPLSVQSLALFSPPSFMDGFPRRFPRLYRALASLDERLGRLAPFNSWGDFYLLAVRHQPT
jgi:ubiquinone/menaquinone biosynthesis C-methylase UbiE